MLIISGHLKVPAADRQAFIDAHKELVERGRAFPGCLDLAISPDPVDPARINNVELWNSEESLAAWRKIANPPKHGIEIEGGDLQKHQISGSGPPF